MINEITLAHVASPLLLGNLGASFSAALATVVAEFVLFIPRIIEALIVLIVGYLIVSAVVRAVRFSLQKVNFERHLGQTNLGKTVERSGQTITNIIVTTIKWLLLLVVIVYAISVLSIAPLTTSMLAILAWLPDLAGAVIIIFVGALIASYVGKMIGNTLPRYGVGGARLIALAVELLIYALVINFAMIQLGFGQGIIYTASTALSWGLAAALAIGLGAGIAYSFREVVPPMMSGATTIASTLKKGQQISVEGIPNTGNGGKIAGTVRSVGMWNTIIEQQTPGTGFLILPNALLMDKPVMVTGGEEPRPMEQNLGDTMTDFNEKFEANSENPVASVPATNSTDSSDPFVSNNRVGPKA
jgi:Conserved TM helix